MRKAFSDIEADERMKIRAALEEAGSVVVAYAGESVQVAVKRGCFEQVESAARQNGLEPTPNGCCYFPLGSDHPAEEFRHDLPKYGRAGDRSCWLYSAYRPVKP